MVLENHHFNKMGKMFACQKLWGYYAAEAGGKYGMGTQRLYLAMGRPFAQLDKTDWE